MALFEIQNFSFAYPKTQEPALKEISFSLEEGELFLLSGASGSGKTTLFAPAEAGDRSLWQKAGSRLV